MCATWPLRSRAHHLVYHEAVLPPDVTEVAMQKEILTPPKIPPLDSRPSLKMVGRDAVQTQPMR